jgi:hypothetical protein
MDYGSHITIGGTPILLGRSYWSSANWLSKCNILKSSTMLPTCEYIKNKY